MDNFIPNPNKQANPNDQVIFHPIDAINEDRQAIVDNQRDTADNKKEIDILKNTQGITGNKKVIEHVTQHYRKYLFGLGVVAGFAIAITTRIFFGTSSTSSTTQAGYESLTPELNAIIVFNEMDAIAHIKDDFFHQTGKIYTITGETLFRRYDTLFHVLDNAYHRSITTADKIKRAQRLAQFYKIQDTLFTSTIYMDPVQDAKMAQLDKEFVQILAQIESDKMPTTTGTVTTNPIMQ